MEAWLGGLQNQQNGRFSRQKVDFPVLELSWWRLGLAGSKTSPITKIAERGFRELFSGNFRAHVTIPEMDEEKYQKDVGKCFREYRVVVCCPCLTTIFVRLHAISG